MYFRRGRHNRLGVHAAVRPVLRRFLAEFEGNLNYMYADSKRLITTGIGNLINSIPAAQALHWTLGENSSQGANLQQVSDAWNEVSAHRNDVIPQNMPRWGYFRQFTSIRLPPWEIERLFNSEVDRFARELTAIFPSFGDYPADAQLGMLVHAWALGTGTLNTRWPSYTDACQNRDWEVASRECIWAQLRQNRDHAQRRRAALERMFQNAANVEEWNRGGYSHDPTLVWFPEALPPLLRPPTPEPQLRRLRSR